MTGLERALPRRSPREPAWARRVVIGLGVGFVALFVVIPLAAVAVAALSHGLAAYARAIADPQALRALRLTLYAAAIAVPANLVFGVAAAWAIARFRFPGRALLITLIDLPLAVSPVIAGMVFVLLFGAHGLIGPWLAGHGVRVIFAFPGIVLATTFVTLPYVARELIPLMEAQGQEEEEAALVLGASGWQTFVRVTLPKIKWGLVYGVVLCTARAMGEFGAVSVVSGNIRGRTSTLHAARPDPLRRVRVPGGVRGGLAARDDRAREPDHAPGGRGDPGATRGGQRVTISVQSISRRFGAFTALDDVSLEIPSGELVALLGPSGSGKTSLLRILAGLERPDRGRALLDGADLVAQSARQRNVGLVFQHYALFRHLDVFENVAFALRVRNRPDAEVRARVTELLQLVQLEGLGRRLPSQLSGGQRQRIALARALAARPRVLLLDEPFGALDAQVRAELRGWLRRLHDEIHLTTVFVTHDQDEAFEVADRVVVMNRGRIEQVGSPAEVFERPANDFVMRFLGHVNVLDARLERGRAHVGDVVIEVDHPEPTPRAGRIYVRPHEVEIGRARVHGSTPARVLRVTPVGAGLKIELAAPGLGASVRADLDWERGAALGLRGGDDVFLSLRRARVFAPAT